MNKTATFLRDLDHRQGWNRFARVKLYWLDPALPVRTLAQPTVGPQSPVTNYVAVSSLAYSRQAGKPETQVFLTDQHGQMKLSDLLTQAKVQQFDAYSEALAVLGYTVQP